MNERFAYSPDNSVSQSARKRLRPRDLVTRSAVAELLRTEERPGLFENISHVIARRYGNCSATEFYTRAAVNPASSTTVGWAAELVGSSIADFLADMQRQSAFASLAQEAMTLPMPVGVGSIKVPGRTSPVVLAGAWTAEGGPKPVAAISLSTVSLVPYKLTAISAFSEEMLQYSTVSIEALVNEALKHDVGGLLDQTMLDSSASSSVRPAGLFQGVTPITPSALTPATEALYVDLKALTAAVSANNADAKIVFFANAAQTPRMIAAGYQPIKTNFLSPGSVAAVDATAIAMTASSPSFSVSRSALIHMDSAPSQYIGTAGSPNVVSAPTSSAFQTDNVAIRTTMKAGWIRRRSGCTAIINGALW